MQTKFYKLLSNAKQGLLAFVLTVFLSTAYSQTYTLSYTGGTQTLMIPATGNYLIECWGGDGGDVTAGPGGGGKGGYSVGEFNVTSPGLVLNILVGGKGGSASGTGSPAGAGGWNGGGGGGTIGRSGGGGGGATDVRLGGLSASNRIIVAGGGGGAAYYAALAAGGNGGGTIAQNGDAISSGNVVTTGGGGAGANGGSPGLSSTGFLPTNGTTTGGGGGGNSAGVGVGQQGIGGGAGGAGGAGGSGSTGSSAGGGGGFAGGAGGTQTGNMGAAGGGGSGFIGGVSNGTTVAMGQTGFVPNPAVTGNGIVVITRLCNISIFTSQNPMCIGNTISLTTDALSGITWFSGSNAPAVNVNPTVTTTYSLVGTSTIIVGTGTANCITNSFITVTVNPLPVLSIVAFPTVACSGGTSSLTGLGAVSPTSYSWSNGMNGVQTATVIPIVNTIYTLTGVNNFGCSNTQTIELLVNTNTLTVNQSTTAICSGKSATLAASGAVTYTWSNGLMFQNIPVTPTITTIYTVTATDLNNCNISNSLTLTVFNNPTVSISANKTALCKGESITLTGEGATSYSWSSNVQTSSVVYTLTSDITYYYSVTGIDANGCSSIATYSISAAKCTGINESTNFGAVVGIYPNPSNGQYNISISEVTDHLDLKVYNTLGMLVKSQKILFTESKLDLMNENNGIYFAKICDQGNVVKVIRIIKE